MPRLDISWCVFDELIEEEEEEEEAWTGWYETLLKTRGWFPRVHVEEHIYIYICRERESCMNIVVEQSLLARKWL